MLKTVILIIVFFVVLIFAGIVTKHFVENQNEEEIDYMNENQFTFNISKNYSYNNSKVERILSVEGKKEISVKIWSFNVLGNLSIKLYNPEGDIFLEREGKNMDDSLSITLERGSYLLDVDFNHTILGGYALGFRNIDDLHSPVIMDSLGIAEDNPEKEEALLPAW
ncbi:MAG: hypothetical protein V5A47_01735 [Bacteroidales bacterium]